MDILWLSSEWILASIWAVRQFYNSDINTVKSNEIQNSPQNNWRTEMVSKLEKAGKKEKKNREGKTHSWSKRNMFEDHHTEDFMFS